MAQPNEILEFWFSSDSTDPLKNAQLWFAKSDDFDKKVRELFLPSLVKLKSRELEEWKDSAKLSLAYILLADQFSRNIFRDQPESFEADLFAFEATLQGLEKGYLSSLSLVEQWFFLMPLMHSEDLEFQRLGVQKFRTLLEEAKNAGSGDSSLIENNSTQESIVAALEMSYDYAIKHFEIIERFRRFPHRNKVLGRKSSQEELEFLKQPGSSF